MKQIIALSLLLTLSTAKAQLKSQLPKSLDEKQYEEYKNCSECLEQWKNNVSGQAQQGKQLNVSNIEKQAATAVKSKGRLILGIVSTVVVGGIVAVLVKKSNTLTNVFTQ